MFRKLRVPSCACARFANQLLDVMRSGGRRMQTSYAIRYPTIVRKAKTSPADISSIHTDSVLTTQRSMAGDFRYQQVSLPTYHLYNSKQDSGMSKASER